MNVKWLSYGIMNTGQITVSHDEDFIIIIIIYILFIFIISPVALALMI